MGGNTRDAGRTTLNRVFAVLEAFTVEAPFLSLTEIADGADLPMATAHRIIAELVEWGALERLPHGRYHVGLRLWELGSLAPRQRDLRTGALPFMQDLYEATRENVQLAVRDGAQALILESLSGPRSVGTVTEVGGRLPLHATGVGKVILAWSEPELTRDVVEDGLRRYTPHTITAAGRLADGLARARSEHVAYSLEEMTLGAVSVAAPILGPDGNLRAALAIVVRSVTDLRRYTPAVRAAALGIARRLPVDCSAPTGATSAGR